MLLREHVGEIGVGPELSWYKSRYRLDTVMLQEITKTNNHSIKMNKQKLTIHHANLFIPNIQEIFKMAWGRENLSLAILRRVNRYQVPNQCMTIIEIYKLNAESITPKLIRRYIDLEQDLTDIVWVGFDNFVTSSKQQTLNLYSVKSNLCLSTKITDYGPINCLRYFPEPKLLLSGTELGHVTSYKVDIKGKAFEPLDKMVKVNGAIKALYHNIVKRYVPPPSRPKTRSSKKPTKPGKRKKPDSDEELDDDDTNERPELLDTFDITIYGACQNDVVAWNYHKKTIIETMHVCDKSENVTTLICLRNGDIVAGDSTGSVNVFDHNSYTCRQTLKVFQTPISCLAKSHKDSRVLVSSQQDSTVVILEKKRSYKEELIMFEKIQVQAHDVTSMVFFNTKEFFSGGSDGILVKTELHINLKELKRHTMPPNFVDKIKCNNSELMFQYYKNLVIWKLEEKRANDTVSDSLPIKHLLMKTRDYIFASAFCDNLILYSTKKGLYMINRKEEKLYPHRLYEWEKSKIGNVLKACLNNRFLLVGLTSKSLLIMNLDKTGKATVEHSMKSPIKQIIELREPAGVVAVVCSGYFYLFDLNTEKRLSRATLYDEASFMAYDETNATIYIYTFNDRLTKVTIDDKANATIEPSKERIQGLPNDANMLGMLLLPKDECIIYDHERMFKVDISSNKVVNVNSDYKYILKMESLFNKPNQVALVELGPDYFARRLPATVTKKFGNK